MRVFVNEEGSTSLTVILAVVLVVALMAVSLQWYWVQTSSSDIQYLADMGALTSTEVIARTTKTIQVLDLTIASLNLFGLILHAIVVISGVVILSSSTIGGSWLAPFFSKAVEFNRKFIDMRKRFSKTAFEVAQKINVATPFLAYGYAANFVSNNVQLLEGANSTSYQIITVPFPLTGEVSQGVNHNQDDLVDITEEANSNNSETLERIQELEKKCEEALKSAYILDAYRPAGQTFADWSITKAVKNFESEFVKRKQAYLNKDATLLPIDSNSESAKAKLAQGYKDTKRDVLVELEADVKDALGLGVMVDGSYGCSSINLDDALRGVSQERAYLLEHEEGERKAYHRISHCQGLSNAQSPLQQIVISKIIGDSTHPPCSLCLPPHWEAVEHLKDVAEDYVVDWNLEVAAIAYYESLLEQIDEQSELLRENTSSAFDEILSEAEAILKSGRISYHPPGSRGVLSVCISSSPRKMPSYTLPFVTNSENVELGTQFAMAGARLFEVKDSEDNKSNLLSISNSIQDESPTLGGALFHLLGKDEKLGALKPLWDMCTKVIVGKPSEFSSLFKDLPLGLGVIGGSFFQELTGLLGISKPDTRVFKPVLVNTSQLGSGSAPGLEGSFVRSLTSAKERYFNSGPLNTETLRELLEESLDLYPSNANQMTRSLLPANLEYGGVSIPFNIHFTTVVSSQVTRLRTYGRDWISSIAGSK